MFKMLDKLKTFSQKSYINKKDISVRRTYSMPKGSLL